MTELGTGGPPSARERAALLAEHPRFRQTILVLIVFNALLLGLETSGRAMEAAGPLITGLNHACLAIFVVEIGLKIYAWRLDFFRRAWNVLDFVIIGIALMPAGDGASVIRGLRVLRVVRLVNAVPRLRRVIEGFVMALPGMGSVLLLMAIIYYIGAVLATRLFGATHPQWFGTVGESAYSLFQIMTLESWSMGIVRPVMEAHPNAWAFFVPFIVVTSFAVVNLVVGLIVNSMQDAHSGEANQATDDHRSAVIEKLEAIERRLARIEARGSGGTPGT